MNKLVTKVDLYLKRNLSQYFKIHYNRNSQPIIEDDEDEAPVKRGFFRRK